MALRIVTPPASEPLTTAEAKAHLRVTTTDDDTYIAALITAAREAVEHRLGRSLMQQTLGLTLDRFPACVTQWSHPVNSSAIVLLKSPVQSVTWIKYQSTDNVLTTLSGAAYVVDTYSEPGRVLPAYGYSWPDVYDTPNAVEIRYVAGYADADSVPTAIKQWMLLRIGAMYENREEVTVEARAAAVMMPFADSLLDRYWLPEIG